MMRFARIISFVVTVCVGLIVVLPQIFFVWGQKSVQYTPYPMRSDAETHYLARIQEVVDGGGPGNPFISEYKNSVPTSLYTFSETFLALPGVIFGISVPALNLFYKFLLPVILSLLVYALFFELTESLLWSIVVMIVVVLGHSLLNIPDILHLLNFEKVYTAFLMYARPVNPQFSSIFFLLYLICLLNVWKGRGRRWGVYLGLLLGASFYVYFYSFTFLLALTAVSIIVSLCVKKFSQAKELSLIFCAGIIIGSPVIYQLYTFVSQPLYADLTTIFGYHLSHAPIVSLAGVITASLLILWYYLRGKNEEKGDYYFISSLVLTAFLVINQQVITGRILEEGHYHWYFNTPIFIITLLWLGWRMWGRQNDVLIKTVLCMIGLVSITNGLFIQYSSYQNNIEGSKRIQEYGPVLKWLDTNTEKESVIFANEDFSQFVPVYTANNVVWEDHADYYLMSLERRQYRPEKIMQSNDLQKELKKYRVDYVVWDSVINPDWHFGQYRFLTPVYLYKNFTIYKIK